MKDLTKEDLELIDELLEPYRDTLETIMSFTDTKSDAEMQAYVDWATDEIVNKLSITPLGAKMIVEKLEQDYILKTRRDV